MRLLALTAAVAAAVACGSTEAAGPRTPTLDIATTTPLVVRGRGFVPRERVRLLVSADRLLVRAVRVGAGGGFRVRLPLAADRCQAITVQAIGNRGSRASADVAAPHCEPIG